MSETADKRAWKIIYSDYSGPEKKAIELISREAGSLILRDTGVYTIHVLACERAQSAVLDKNAIIVGTYARNAWIRRYIREEEIPACGYAVRVMDNPEAPAYKLVLITAREAVGVFYGAVDFVDDYFAFAAPKRGHLTFPQELFTVKLPDYFHASAPKIRTRCIFTWGQPINDYRNYIDNMARMRLNQLIIWNDYVPLNAKDIIAYAHEYGIQIIWGYAWGWTRNCARNADLEHLDQLAEEVLRKYEDEYADTGADGIYFQSFTELSSERIGGKLVAETVTDFVNKTAGMFLEKYPGLQIQFGLHASSVKEQLSYIKKLDRRVSIIWEDCGAFPYGYQPCADSEEAYQRTVEFTDKILALRGGCSRGMLYKGQMVMDWMGDHFVHQSGPYILGMASEDIIRHDREMMKPIWKKFQNGWLQNGRYAYEMTRHIAEKDTGDVTLGMAGQLAGGIWFPSALCAQILWECDAPYGEILQKVLSRRCVTMV